MIVLLIDVSIGIALSGILLGIGKMVYLVLTGGDGVGGGIGVGEGRRRL